MARISLPSHGCLYWSREPIPNQGALPGTFGSIPGTLWEDSGLSNSGERFWGQWSGLWEDYVEEEPEGRVSVQDVLKAGRF